LAATAARMSSFNAASSIFSPFGEGNRTAHVSRDAGIEGLLRIAEGGAASQGELHDLLVRFLCADHAVIGKNRDAGRCGLRPFPLLDDVGIGLVEELTETGEGFPAPVSPVP